MNTLKTIIIGFLAGLAGAFAFVSYQQEKESRQQKTEKLSIADFSQTEVYKPNIVAPSEYSTGENADFSFAAAKATPSVVYINSISQTGASYSYWDLLFGGGGSQTQ